jgi:hypothetical protein
VQHLEWTRHGRRYHHQDEGKPNTFTLTTAIGQVNVDVAGDGSSFAPYVLNGASLRSGDSECVFSDGWQEIKRLGQTLVSKSRLYVQRDIAGTWTDVPHGVPTRNVAHDYPTEGKCTAYLDFPDIQGYAAGARLQVGVEVGGGDRQIYGFRFRSPVAGTFRLEWVLEIPEEADLAWIEEPTSRTDRTLIRVGGRIGSTTIRWSRAEVPFRSATVEPVAGGRILHMFLGPYTVAAQEWLTIYPDTMAPALSNTNEDGENTASTWYVDGFTNFIYCTCSAAPEFPAWSFSLSALAATVTVDSMYLRVYARESSATDAIFTIRTEAVDPATQTIWSSTHLPSASTTGINTLADQTRTFAVSTWYFGASDTHPLDLAADLQDLLTAYGDIASGNRINFAMIPRSAAAGWVGLEDYSHAGANEAELLITYTAAGSWEPQVDAPEKIILVSPAMGWR